MQQEPQRVTVNARPVKSFFVSMLTRDIQLEEAILDLLDNCVDGILRTGAGKSDQPYEGYWADITFDESSFVIADNCGGIPETLLDYAFRLGRDPNFPEDEKARGAVGVYGIGMKRAIFKMGESCLISTQNGNDNHQISITRQWLRTEDEWDIPYSRIERTMGEDGTRIEVRDIRTGIADTFAQDDFEEQLTTMVSTHYSFIIDKGFRVNINGTSVPSRSRGFVYTTDDAEDGSSIRPFTYQAVTDEGVEIFMAVGFNGPIPSEDDAVAEQDDKSNSSEKAGWTVICNDRAVLFCDKSELTGWGDAGVPRYHTQFIAVSGVVEFKCADPEQLPTTTTKRGVDGSSVAYLRAKNKMRQGMQLFTGYTNRWKSRPTEVRQQFALGDIVSFSRVKDGLDGMPLARTTSPISTGQQYLPKLPIPPRDEPRTRRITFTKNVEDVRTLAEYLFDDSEEAPSRVGEECFDIVLQEANS